ncbi:MAG: DUF4432 family protein [Ruminococcaceae bacterium]|nr:DUF4432 family protein [Oscillospiraceae bacterium]
MNRINLYKEFFVEKERTVFSGGSLKATLFKYANGIEAVKLSNDKGYVTLLPFVGQQVWDMEFLGHNMVMKSIYDEPEVCYATYGESYGAFLMHCGLTAMGNPTSEDTHLPHGELPIAKYNEAYIIIGEDEKGKYVSLSGSYLFKRAFEHNYEFMPECRLYENASTIQMFITLKNHKDLPLEYFYLCHINYRPVDGAKLYYTAKPENITPHHEVPEGYPEALAAKTNDYLDRLDKDTSIMDTIDPETQSYAPEIVFTCKYDADENGDAHTMQLLPDGYACYVSHKPGELPFGLRWIARTADEDALGMVLPATAQHMGYLYCKERGQEKYLQPGETLTYHITTGILSPEESDKIKNKIIALK